MHKEALYLYGFCKGKKLPLTLDAITFASELHSRRFRDNGEEEIKHPLEVLRRLVNYGIENDPTLAAATLHDTVEDGLTTLEVIEKRFGKEVANLIDRVSKRKTESEEEYYERIAGDIRAIIIKTVDRVCNISDMVGVFTVKRTKNYVKQTEKYVLPMMKKARRQYIDYSDQLVAIRDNIRGVLRPTKENINLQEENEKLRQLLKENNIDIPVEQNAGSLSSDKLHQADEENPAFTPLAETVENLG